MRPPLEIFSLGALLVCDSCDLTLQPVLTTDGRRGYRAPCGCRLAAVDAAVVERLVQDIAELHGADIDSPPDTHALRDVFAQVRIGGSTDDLSPVWRI
jgi:hypothetical protein